MALKSYKPGDKNVMFDPLVDAKNVFLPPLHLSICAGRKRISRQQKKRLTTRH